MKFLLMLVTINFGLTSLQAAFAQIEEKKAPEAKFNLDHPMGKVMVQKGNRETIYLGYFCLLQEVTQNGKAPCLKSQFGKGRDLFLGVDFLGNQTTELGTWQPIGPVFDAKSGNEFYMKTLEGEHSKDFADIWKAAWNKEGFNWSQNPVEIRKSKLENFVALLDSSVQKSDPLPEVPVAVGSSTEVRMSSPDSRFTIIYDLVINNDEIILNNLQVEDHAGYRYQFGDYYYENEKEDASRICRILGLEGITSTNVESANGLKKAAGTSFKDLTLADSNFSIKELRCSAANGVTSVSRKKFNGFTKIEKPFALVPQKGFLPIEAPGSDPATQTIGKELCKRFGFANYQEMSAADSEKSVMASAIQTHTLDFNAAAVGTRFIESITCY